MAKKAIRKYCVSDLEALLTTLDDHAAKMVAIIRGCSMHPQFDQVVKVRDAAQFLLSTLSLMDHIRKTLIPLTAATQPREVPGLHECGLDWNPDEE